MIAVQASYQFIEGDMESTQAGNYYNTFVSTNTIKLVEGDDFQVTDGNACNKGGAAFMLPANPFTCPEADPECLDTDPTFQEYEVYVRLVGKPGTGIGVTGCAVDQGVDLIEGTADDIIICSTENVVKVRETGKGKMQFDNVSKELLTLCVDTLVDGNLDGNCDDRVALFDPEYYDYFWQWNTQGKAHAQIVFVAVPD
jgi:hypothetical protein